MDCASWDFCRAPERQWRETRFMKAVRKNNIGQGSPSLLGAWHFKLGEVLFCAPFSRGTNRIYLSFQEEKRRKKGHLIPCFSRLSSSLESLSWLWVPWVTMTTERNPKWIWGAGWGRGDFEKSLLRFLRLLLSLICGKRAHLRAELHQRESWKGEGALKSCAPWHSEPTWAIKSTVSLVTELPTIYEVPGYSFQTARWPRELNCFHKRRTCPRRKRNDGSLPNAPRLRAALRSHWTLPALPSPPSVAQWPPPRPRPEGGPRSRVRPPRAGLGREDSQEKTRQQLWPKLHVH